MKLDKCETDPRGRIFFREHCDFGTKSRKSELNSSHDLFFLENTMSLGRKIRILRAAHKI